MTFMYPRAILGAVAGALGAFAAAAAISVPTAHADDFSSVLADVTATEATAATAFATASSDLAAGGSETAAGYAQLFTAIDDDLFAVPREFEVGFLDLLQGDSVLPASDFDFSITAPTSIAQSVTEANAIYAEGAALITTIAGLPSSDYATIALDNGLSVIDQYVLPEQIELIAHLAFGF